MPISVFAISGGSICRGIKFHWKWFSKEYTRIKGYRTPFVFTACEIIPMDVYLKENRLALAASTGIKALAITR